MRWLDGIWAVWDLVITSYYSPRFKKGGNFFTIHLTKGENVKFSPNLRWKFRFSIKKIWLGLISPFLKSEFSQNQTDFLEICKYSLWTFEIVLILLDI